MATDLQEALELSGGFGKFQLYATIVCIGSELRSACTMFCLPLLELEPTYECLVDNGWQICTPSDFCSDPSLEHRIDYSNTESLNNWYEKLNLACESQKTIGMIGSAYFLGMAVGCMIIPRLADLYGRRNFILACNIMALPVLGSFWSMHSAQEAIVRYFILGCGLSGFVVVNFLYLMEFLVKRHRVTVYTIARVLCELSVVFVVLYFRFLTKDWEYWFYMIISIEVLVIIGLT